MSKRIEETSVAGFKNITMAEKILTIKEGDVAARTDAYLAKIYPQFSRNQWQARIESGHVLVNGIHLRPSRKLNPGDVLTLFIPLKVEPQVNRNYRVLFEDDHLLVIEKPSGMPVHPSGVYRTQTLYNFLLEDKPYLKKIHLAHRLDRETSGVLVLAKDPNSARQLQRMFARHEIYKEYRVLVHGDFPEQLMANGFLSRDMTSRLARKQKFTEIKPNVLSQSARTAFLLIGQLHHAGQAMSLLKAILHTGRHHQIRATLAALGYPVVGDKLYGLDESFYFKFSEGFLTAHDQSALVLDRCALHCHTISFKHVATAELVSFTSEVNFLEGLSA